MEIIIGKLPKGIHNSISDVSGVKVGHTTIDNAQNKTGVTVILPCEDDIYQSKMIAACHVLNGFGKSLGLMQIQELGTLESPIALTNTLNVGLVHDALVEYLCTNAENSGYSIRSVNPVVCECNDASLNNIRYRAVGYKEVMEAIQNASVNFKQGDVGAGKGMTCHDLKGGIGSSSRILSVNGENFTIGVLVLSNHGSLNDLIINGSPIGQKINALTNENNPDEGSCIMIVATDLPVTSRQLGRIIRRCSVGLARLGSYIGHGSGEVMIGFSTANRIPQNGNIMELKCIHESQMDLAFRAVAEATEEAVINSMVYAKSVTGYSGKVRESITKYWNP